jgi:hypothetical protein
MAQAARADGRRVFGSAPFDVCSWLDAASNPSSSSDRTAAERLMPPRLAHALTDMKSEAGSRTVTSGSSGAAPALLVVFCALIISKLIAFRTCVATQDLGARATRPPHMFPCYATCNSLFSQANFPVSFVREFGGNALSLFANAGANPP